MKDNTVKLIVGMVCLTIGYACASLQGINGMLFTAFTNAILAITLGSAYLTLYTRLKQQSVAAVMKEE